MSIILAESQGGQFVNATVKVPPPKDVVEVPTDAVIDDGRQSLVFVQPDAADPHKFTMRRVQVMRRFENTIFVRSSPIPEAEQLTPSDKEAGLFARALETGELVLLRGSLDIKSALMDLEEQEQAKAASHQKKSDGSHGS